MYGKIMQVSLCKCQTRWGEFAALTQPLAGLEVRVGTREGGGERQEGIG